MDVKRTSAIVNTLRVAALAAVLSIGVACNAGAPEGSDDGGSTREGPLTAVNIDGQRIPDRNPGKKAGIFTFGAVSLCSTQPGADIELERVRYDYAVPPTRSVPWLRTVPIVDGRGNTNALSWRPMISTQGFPPEKLKGDWRGIFTKEIADYTVNQRCFGVSNLDSRRQELLTSMVVGPEGADLDRILVDYQVGPSDYTLELKINHQVCGTDVCR